MTSSFHMYSMSPSSPGDFSRAGARVNQTTITVGAEPNSALVQLENRWVVPGRNLPQCESRLFAMWKWQKLMHSGPDPAKIYSRVFNALHSEQSLRNCWQYFRYVSDSQHHSVTAPHRPNIFVLTVPDAMERYFRSGRQRCKTWDPPTYWGVQFPATGEKRRSICLWVKITEMGKEMSPSEPSAPRDRCFLRNRWDVSISIKTRTFAGYKAKAPTSLQVISEILQIQKV